MKRVTFAIFVLISLAFLSNMVSAESSFVYKLNEKTDVVFSCLDSEYSYCNSTTTCNITVFYPNQSALVNNKQMTRNPTYYNYSITPPVTGEYYVTTNCQSGSENGFASFNFDVTYNGLNPGSGVSSIGIIAFLLILNIFLFGISFKEKITENKYTNFMIKKGVLIIAIFVLMLNFTVLSSLSTFFTLGITPELHRYMIVIGWVGYITIIYTLVASLFKLMGMLKEDKENERTGNDEDD